MHDAFMRRCHNLHHCRLRWPGGNATNSEQCLDARIDARIDAKFVARLVASFDRASAEARGEAHNNASNHSCNSSHNNCECRDNASSNGPRFIAPCTAIQLLGGERCRPHFRCLHEQIRTHEVRVVSSGSAARLCKLSQSHPSRLLPRKAMGRLFTSCSATWYRG